MGWRNPPWQWSELEALLSDRGQPEPDRGQPEPDGGQPEPDRGQPEPDRGQPGPGGGQPGRDGGQPGPRLRPVRRSRDEDVPYAELHCHSNFSFLDGASHPAELVETAARLGLRALALTDHDGLYGVVQFAQAAEGVGLSAVFGAELTLGLTRPQNGIADPEGSHLVVLARDPIGYSRLSRALTYAQLTGGEKGRPAIDVETLAAFGAGGGPAGEGGEGGEGTADHWVVLTGCRKGTVPQTLVERGPAAAKAELARLVRLFGRDQVCVELWNHGDPLDSARNDALVALADHTGVEVVATNNVHYHEPARRRLATALAAVRARRSLDELDGWLPAAATAHLRSGNEQAARFARYPGVVERAAAIGLECAFDLRLVAPRLPPFQLPAGWKPPAGWEGQISAATDEMTLLRCLTELGAGGRYGPRRAPRLAQAYQQIDHELDVIEQLGFAGYFLIVWDIVQFCQQANIYCQGRGSAANSAVCYALGITNADAVGLNLLFERFLSSGRDEPPDIDLDIESGRREEAIQYVYRRYGRQQAAQVANVITYRPRSAIRDIGKALGHGTGVVDAWSKQLDHWAPLPVPGGVGPQPASSDEHPIPAQVLELAGELQDAPRHLGIHPGGMVICDRPVSEVCPVEWARRADRSVLQWDKDDCAAAGLVKFDLLGLGMLSAVHATVDHIKSFWQIEVDLANLEQESEVYEMLSRADSVGVFQVESRAQMATLPRLRPQEFYDLVIEVALIRPGPIQGGSVHPYLRRRNHQEDVTYLHPLLQGSLEKTKGVPLFQEQLMRMATDVAGFSPSEAARLCRAMGSKRSSQKMAELRGRFYRGMRDRGITGDVADQIWEKLAAFSNFGFPESHAVSFAHLVYSSAWMKYHYPSAFCAGLLDSQPMGFWSPQTLVADARRHGVVVHRPDINGSDANSLLEPDKASAGGAAVRLGLRSVRQVGDEVAARIVAARADGPFRDVEDVARRGMVGPAAMEALATADAFACFGRSRREALWSAGAVGVYLGSGKALRLPGLAPGTEPPALRELSVPEANHADLWAMGLSPDNYPTEFVRDQLDQAGVTTACRLAEVASGNRVTVAGVVTHRQRPSTAGGTIFLNLEDETGLINVICSAGLWARYGHVARSRPALVIHGRLESAEGAFNVIAERIEDLSLAGLLLRSRDFR